MEKYPRGRRGSPAKGVVRDTVARVQIPLSGASGHIFLRFYGNFGEICVRIYVSRF